MPVNERFGAVLPERALFQADESLFAALTDHAALIETLLSRHSAVRIPALSFPLVLTRPIRLESGMYLSIHESTILRMAEGCGGCMVRNANIHSGIDGPIPDSLPRDADIIIEGGQWEDSRGPSNPYDDHPAMQEFGRRGMLLGAAFFCHTERVTVRNMLVRRSTEYAVLLADCRDFLVEHMTFDHNRMDGVHVNGPASHGLIQYMTGPCGDDFAALNAWDWDTSAVSFGPIRGITIRHLTCERNEMRILPGRKTYPDGTQLSCPVENCRYEDISGVYSFKLYQQPNCHNLWREVKDYSDVPGLIKNVAFSGIHLLSPITDALGEVRPAALFEMGCDCEDITLEDIDLDFPPELMRKTDMTLATIGPKSSTWKRGNPDPAQWAELFDPDLICTADRITFRGIRFAGQLCTDPDMLMREMHLSVNPDYPRTTPKGGTGFGVMKTIRIEP